MCAINPKRQQHYTISIYTSLNMTQEEFDELVAQKLIAVENLLNTDSRLRWHIKYQDEKDYPPLDAPDPDDFNRYIAGDR